MPSALSPNRPPKDIEDAANAHQRAMNNSRYIPETPEIYREAAERARVFIFNVGPWAHRRELGSAGSFNIRPCPKDAEYSEPVVLLGVVEEPYPINEAECKVNTDTGMNLALQIIGEGPHVPRSSSFVPYGVFISRSETPSKQAIEKAREKLKQRYLELVKEADEAHAQGPAFARQVISPDWHFVAARALKKTAVECKWMENSEVPAERDSCPGCGEVYNKGIVRHACGWIFDREKWEQNQGAPAAGKTK